jgi:hypothetical protein
MLKGGNHTQKHDIEQATTTKTYQCQQHSATRQRALVDAHHFLKGVQ